MTPAVRTAPTPTPEEALLDAGERYLRDDRDYQKVWWELQALSWNRPATAEALEARAEP